jgi:hypothetical protein
MPQHEEGRSVICCQVWPNSVTTKERVKKLKGGKKISTILFLVQYIIDGKERSGDRDDGTWDLE